MKKIIFAVAVLAYSLLVSITGNSQTTNQVPREVKEAFEVNFKNANLLNWKNVKEAYVATVNHENRWIEAYFSEEGEFKGTGRYIESALMPAAVKQKLSSQFGDYELDEVYEYSCNETGICFFITMHNEKFCQIVRISPSGKVLYREKEKVKKQMQ